MSLRSKPQRANSFSLSSPITSFNKFLTMTRHSSSQDISIDNDRADTRSEIFSNNFSFKRASTDALSRVRRSVINSAPSSRSKSASYHYNEPITKPITNVKGVKIFTTANKGTCAELTFTQTSLKYEFPKDGSSTVAAASSSSTFPATISTKTQQPNHFNHHHSYQHQPQQSSGLPPHPQEQKTEKTPNVPRRSKSKTRNKCPDKETEHIDYLNIGETIYNKTNLSSPITTLTIQTRNFKMFKAEICPRDDSDRKEGTITTQQFERMRQFFNDIYQQNLWRERGRPMILEKNLQHSKSYLWEYLHRTYPYKQRTDFEQEFHEAEDERLINLVTFDNTQLSQTLPPVIPSVTGCTSSELENVGHYSADNRIPFVCYVHLPTKTVLVRSTIFSFVDKIDFVSRATKSSYDVRHTVGRHLDINDSYEKMKKAVFNVLTLKLNTGIHNSTIEYYEIDKSKKFWSKISGWLVGISRALQKSTEISNNLLSKASTAIFEPFDCEWNCVLSSLVQVILEPKCRTMDGFERMISKEWLYFSGYRKTSTKVNSNSSNYIVRFPSSVMFNLFLDCVHQLICQNSRSFQFSSNYLLLLWDTVFQAVDCEKNFDTEFIESRSQNDMKNFLYNDGDKQALVVDSHVTNVRFFRALYFRQVRIDNFHLDVPETMQKELHRSR